MAQLEHCSAPMTLVTPVTLVHAPSACAGTAAPSSAGVRSYRELQHLGMDQQVLGPASAHCNCNCSIRQPHLLTRAADASRVRDNWKHDTNFSSRLHSCTASVILRTLSLNIGIICILEPAVFVAQLTTSTEARPAGRLPKTHRHPVPDKALLRVPSPLYPRSCFPGPRHSDAAELSWSPEAEISEKSGICWERSVIEVGNWSLAQAR